jgi:hypothetical protein
MGAKRRKGHPHIELKTNIPKSPQSNNIFISKDFRAVIKAVRDIKQKSVRDIVNQKFIFIHGVK